MKNYPFYPFLIWSTSYGYDDIQANIKAEEAKTILDFKKLQLHDANT